MASLDEPIEQVALCHLLLTSEDPVDPTASDTRIELIRHELEEILDRLLDGLQDSTFEAVIQASQLTCATLVLDRNEDVSGEDVIAAIKARRMLRGCYLNVFLALCLFRAQKRLERGERQWAELVESEYIVRMQPDGSGDLCGAPRVRRDDDVSFVLSFDTQMDPRKHGWPYLMTLYIGELCLKRTSCCPDNMRTLARIRARWFEDMKPDVDPVAEKEARTDALLGSTMPRGSVTALIAQVERTEEVISDWPGALVYR